MYTQKEEESSSERLIDVIVAVVGLGTKIALLIWILLAGGVPAMLQESMDDTAAAATVPVATVEVAQVAPTDIPATATVEMLELVPVIPPSSIEDSDVLAPSDFSIDPATLGLTWAARQVGGAAVDPSNRQPGLPPHLLVDLNAEGSNSAGDLVDLSQPQIRILPIAEYLSMMQAAGSPDAAAAFDSLKALLDSQATGPDVTIPTPPILGDLQQQPVARITYIPFEGGQAVGYMTRIGSAGGPIANDAGLTYVIQGVTDDGRYYIVGILPENANFLPDSVADIPSDTLSSIESDVPAYLASVGKEIDDADDSAFTPNLTTVRNVLGTIAIGAGVSAAKESAAVTQVPPAELVGTVWQWTGSTGTDAGKITVDDPQSFEIVFWPDNSYSIKADCNVGGGSYVLDGADLTINPGMMTLAYCGEESLDTAFRAGLFTTTGYEFDDEGNLTLNTSDGGRMTFANGGSSDLAENAESEDQTAADDAGLTSNAYQWVSYTNADGTEGEVPNPEDYVVIMNSDGTFNFTADCNVGNGTYQYNEDGSIVFLPGPMTLAFCGEDSLDQRFLANLTGTTAFTVDDDGNVTAELNDGGTAFLINTGPVSTVGGMTGGATTTPNDIVGTEWQWTRFDDTAETNDIVVPNPEDYTLTLWPDGGFSVKADCNFGRGNYTLDGASLTLEMGPTTRAMCSPDSLSDVFLARLGNTATYVITDEGELVLNQFADAGNMVFNNGGAAELGDATAAEDQPGAADAGLTGQAFTWQSYTDADGNVVTVENPEDYAVVLLPDGTFNIKADCNVGSGTYTYSDDGSLTLDLGPLTRAFCPPDSLSDDFLTFVNRITGATVADDGTVTVTTADGAEGTFNSAGPVAIPQVALPGTGGAVESVPAGDLTNILWQWTSFDSPTDADDLTVEQPAQYQLLFLPDGTYTMRADCNTGSGNYTVDDSGLTIIPGITTLAACSPDSLDGAFKQNVFATNSYTFDSAGNLQLHQPDGSTMTFANAGSASELPTPSQPQVQPPVAANPLEGTMWQWVNFRDAKQDYSVEGPYTIEFLPDGQVAVVADCNNANGTYRVDGSNVTISILVTTAAACGEGSLGGAFIEHLNQAAVYTINGTTLLIDQFADGGTMTFVQAN